MLLIVSHGQDATVDFARPAIRRRGTDHVLLDTDEYPGEIKVAVGGSSGRLELPTGRVELSDVTAVWWRRPQPPEIVGREPAAARWAEEQSIAALDGVWRSLETARWVNHPDHNRRAEDKIGAMRTASDVGLTVPSWIVTNDPQEAQRFASACPHGIVTKPLVRGRVGRHRTLWTTAIDDRSLLEHIGPEPYLLQSLVTKAEDIRVTMIGGDLYAVGLDASGDPCATIDWRRAPRSTIVHTRRDLPGAVAHACLDLVARYQLRFAAIDFVKDAAGDLWFLDLNPNGQWAWIEEETGLPLAARLAEELHVCA